MIYTVTFNPSLDYIVSVKDFELGMTNRTCEEKILPGGKGINVSMVLHNLGYESTAFAYVAGFTGEEIKRRVEEFGIRTEFIQIPEGISRINMKLTSVDGTEINGMGPEISKEKVEELLVKLNMLRQDDILILAGSIPASVPDSIYADIMQMLAGKGIRVVVDATKDTLLNVLPLHPFLIKPNHHELGEIFGVVLMTKESVLPYAKKLKEQGAANVLVSMAGEGAVLVAEDGNVYMSEAPKGTLVNGVGAGDSMVAGFLAGWLEEGSAKKAFKMGLAAGSASAFSKNLATRAEIEAVFEAIA